MRQKFCMLLHFMSFGGASGTRLFVPLEIANSWKMNNLSAVGYFHCTVSLTFGAMNTLNVKKEVLGSVTFDGNVVMGSVKKHIDNHGYWSLILVSWRQAETSWWIWSHHRFFCYRCTLYHLSAYKPKQNKTNEKAPLIQQQCLEITLTIQYVSKLKSLPGVRWRGSLQLIAIRILDSHGKI